jgi:quinol monooxygenase YgiN
MFYRLVRFDLGAGKLDAAAAIFADLVPTISAQHGCESVISFGDAASGSYGFAVLWESAAASEAAKSVIGPQLSQHLAANHASERQFSSELFEVLST